MSSLILMKTFLFILLIISLVAPFTFLKTKAVGNTVTEVTSHNIKKNKEEKIASLTAKSKNIKKNSVVKKALEQPLHDVKIPDFTKISDIKTKKRKFFEFIRPAVIKKNNELLATREKIKTWHEHVSLALPLAKEAEQALSDLVKKYRVNQELSTLAQLNALLIRVDAIPVPLVLVQAANESAWGTSRFSRVGLNFFGIWCYQEGCGMVPNGRDMGQKHEVAAFKSLTGAVNGYFDNINSNKAYRLFRSLRSDLRTQNKALDSQVLATGLLPYSERGADYVVDISDMLRHNKDYFLKKNKQ